MEKQFKLKPEEIERLVPDIGFAFATDKITVDGNVVDFMVRQQPDREDDSGWVFYGGDETQEYIDDPDNTSIFSVNTIANYDPDIIEFLTYPPGTEIERNSEGNLQIISANPEQPDVVFLHPVDQGHFQVTRSWGFNVSGRMLRRFDNGSIVIWRPGFTIWLETYTSSKRTAEENLSEMIERISPEKQQFEKQSSNGIHKARYFLKEEADGKYQDSAYIFGYCESEGINLSIYFDDPQHVSEIEKIWNTLEHMRS